MIRARYERRGPVPQDVIHPAEFETPRLNVGQALVEVVAAPTNPPTAALLLSGLARHRGHPGGRYLL